MGTKKDKKREEATWMSTGRGGIIKVKRENGGNGKRKKWRRGGRGGKGKRKRERRKGRGEGGKGMRKREDEREKMKRLRKRKEEKGKRREWG
jgi:hypothetical protein